MRSGTFLYLLLLVLLSYLSPLSGIFRMALLSLYALLSRMASLGWMAHHVTLKPRDGRYFLTWTWFALNPVIPRQGENPSCYK